MFVANPLSPLTETAQKFLDKALNTSSANKWYSIHLGNLAKSMTAFAMKPLLEELQKALLVQVKERQEKLTRLAAPAIILEIEAKKVANVETGRHPALSVLRREIKKWEMK